MILKRSLVITLGLFIAMFIAACGGSTTTGVAFMAVAVAIHLQPPLQRLAAAVPPP